MSLQLDWRTLARSSPIGWAHRATHGRFRAPRHIRFFANLQQDILAGREELILLSVPPRHGKSMFWSELFPGYFLGSRPDQMVQLASYESTLAAGFGERARNAFAEAAPDVFGLRVHPKRNATDDWRVAGHRGGMQTTGVGGAMTGKTAHLLVIDDPIKGAEQANSETMRNKLWDWWQTEASTRLTPYRFRGEKRRPACVIIHTRWHEDDLIGRLLKEMANGGPRRWRYINLPAIAEEQDMPCPLGRKVGEALWPEMYPAEWFSPYKLNPYWWSALYQGRPQPASGGIFKREYFRYFTEEPHYYVLERPGVGAKRISKHHGYRFTTSDLAASTSTTADYTVTSVWFLSWDADLLLLDIHRDRIEGPDQLTVIENLARRWEVSFVGVESRSYQLTAVQTLTRRGLPVVELHADADKVARALTAAARMQSGTIYTRYHYENNPPCSLSEIEGELLAFPRGAHDDIVDTFAYAAIHAAEGGLRPRVS